MVIRIGNKNDSGDVPSNIEQPTAITVAAHPTASQLNAERRWLYRSPGVPNEGKRKSGREFNPWTSTPARTVVPDSPPAPKVTVAPVAPPPEVVPPAPPSPFTIEQPTVFLNPVASVGPSVYGHEPVAPSEDPVVAVTKAIVSTFIVCIGLWFAISLDVASLMLFFPLAYDGWSGNSFFIPFLGISAFVAFLIALWVGDQSSWRLGVLTFFLLPVGFAAYVFKQNRGMLTRSGQPAAKFPTMVTIGSMIGLAVFLLIASFFFLLHNYGDEISRGEPPFDRYSYGSQVTERPAPDYSLS